MHEATPIGTLAAEERVALGAAALRTFFRIADEWRLSVADQCTLLGDIARSTHHGWRKEAPATPDRYTTDRLTRLSHLLGIYGLVQRLYGESPAYARAWVSAPDHGPVFRGQSPLSVMRDQGIPGLLFVRRILEAEAGGGLEESPAMAWDGSTLASHGVAALG